MSAYCPALDAGELMQAAAALRLAAASVGARAREAAGAQEAVDATGFAGVAAEASRSTVLALGSDLDAHAAQLRTAAGLLDAAAAAQRALDQAALWFPGPRMHARMVAWLNAMSRLLDVRLAQALLGLDDLGVLEQDYDPLFAHPDQDFAALHSGYAKTVPAATVELVEAHGGQIVEAGPASTTVYLGDAVDPSRVITMVAGATTGKPEQLARELEKAQLIVERTGAAVVVWQGYAPPASVPRALSPLPAGAGADDLSMFQAALEERFPTAQKTVVAHSYGTLLATRAAHEHGLLVDDLWLLGSAGVAGNSVDDLTLAGPNSTVHVVDAHADPIRLLRHGPNAALGASPAHPDYGAQRVDGVRGRHSDHFTSPAFLSALAQHDGARAET